MWVGPVPRRWVGVGGAGGRGPGGRGVGGQAGGSVGEGGWEWRGRVVGGRGRVLRGRGVDRWSKVESALQMGLCRLVGGVVNLGRDQSLLGQELFVEFVQHVQCRLCAVILAPRVEVALIRTVRPPSHPVLTFPPPSSAAAPASLSAGPSSSPSPPPPRHCSQSHQAGPWGEEGGHKGFSLSLSLPPTCPPD